VATDGDAATVERINVTPVKGLALQHPDRIELTPDGARDDRRFLLVSSDGRLVNGKRIGGGLGLAAAEWDGARGVLTLTLPDGTVVRDEVQRGGATVTDVYGREIRGHVVEGPFAAALSELAGLEVRLIEREAGAWATDSRPATLVSRASLEAFGGDGRRFRMLLELTGLHAFAEDAWQGRRMSAGEAVLSVERPTPRCALPSYHPDTAERDRDMLREILNVRGPTDGKPCLGVYAEIVEPGVVRVGDRLASV
jgi:uncharacterized protein YcbX